MYRVEYRYSRDKRQHLIDNQWETLLESGSILDVTRVIEEAENLLSNLWVYRMIYLGTN